IVLLFTFYMYWQISFQVLLSYLVCVVLVAFLTSIAPIFIIFIIFKFSFEWFKTWLKFLLILTIYPFFLLLGVTIINYILHAFLIAALNYKVCIETLFYFGWPPYLQLPVPGYAVQLESVGLGLEYQGGPYILSNQSMGAIYGLVNILLAYLFVTIAKRFVDESAATIFGRYFGEYSLSQIVGGKSLVDDAIAPAQAAQAKVQEGMKAAKDERGGGGGK
ncbi:MAG: hypothetical protein AAF153_02175, partial [Pseudomonadota bacterium]